MINKLCNEDLPNKVVPSVNDPLDVTEGPEGKVVDFYLIDEIEDIKDYLDFLREVGTAKSTDIIKVHINCYGGNMDVGYNIFDALRDTKANVEIHIEGACASAASIIMLAGNSWYIYPHAYVMIHCWSGWSYGKWNEQKAALEFEARVKEKQFSEIYKNFLTDEEIKACIEGKDFWMDQEEVLARLNVHQAEAIAKQKAVEEVTSKYQDIMNKEIQGILNTAPKEVKTNKTQKKKSFTKK